MNVIVPMLGDKFYSNADFSSPKPLIEVADKTLFEHSMSFLCGSDEVQKIIFVISKEDSQNFELDSVIARSVGDKNIEVIISNEHTSGAVCTSLLAADVWQSDDELIIFNYDQWINADIATVLTDFRKGKLDFGAISFSSVHPKWSYVQLDDDAKVIRSAEKKPISKNAMAGFYYFKTANLFFRLASDALLSSSWDTNNFYVSELFNFAVLRELVGSVFTIEKKNYFNFYDPLEVENFRVHFEGLVQIDVSKAVVYEYFRALNSRQLQELDKIMPEDVMLEEIGGVKLFGKSNVLKFVEENLFCCEHLEFDVDSVHISGQTAFVELQLCLNSKRYKILDLIQISGDKIQKIRAFITEVFDGEV